MDLLIFGTFLILLDPVIQLPFIALDHSDPGGPSLAQVYELSLKSGVQLNTEADAMRSRLRGRDSRHAKADEASELSVDL